VVTGKELARINHDAAVSVVAWSPDGRLVATGSGDDNMGKVRIVEVATGKELTRVAHDGKVWALAWSPGGASVVRLCSPARKTVLRTSSATTGMMRFLSFSAKSTSCWQNSEPAEAGLSTNTIVSASVMSCWMRFHHTSPLAMSVRSTGIDAARFESTLHAVDERT
jgi:WD40 repeat protein